MEDSNLWWEGDYYAQCALNKCSDEACLVPLLLASAQTKI